MDTSNWINLAIAIGTLGTAFCTVFFYWDKQRRERANRPKLKIGIRQDAPDCQMQKTVKNDNLVNGYWCRLFVKNTGKTAAKQLEVAIEKVEKYENNEWALYHPFLQSNLIWTHNRKTDYKYFMPQLLPGTFKNVDLCCFTKSTNDSDNNIELYVTITNEPFTEYNRIPAGEYKFTIIAGGENCDFTKQEIIVSFSGKWTDNQDEIKTRISLKDL
jgi:hypothetical protein